MIQEKPYKILIVDDSKTVVDWVSSIIQADSELIILGTAENPFEAVKIIEQETPDVILLDIEMPKMDGLTFLKKIMSQHPIPVVIFSGVAPKSSRKALEAFQYGAVEVIQKPDLLTGKKGKAVGVQILQALKSAALAKEKLQLLRSSSIHSNGSVVHSHKNVSMEAEKDKIIFIGASAGGPQALEYLLKNIQPPSPPILICQHMPGDFTKLFAERLNTLSELDVKEGVEGEIIEENHVYIANGFYHLMVVKSGLNYKIHLKDGPLVNLHKPAVDILFKSAARYAGDKAIGILLTGMGSDGATGLLELKKAGAYTLVQDKKSALVWGMPGAAFKLNASHRVLSLKEILNYINNLKHIKIN